MATVSTPASLSSVKSVFGLSAGGSLLGYRRNVISTIPNINHYLAIDGTYPALASFAGKVSPVIAIPITDSSETAPSPATVTASISYNSDGTCDNYGGASSTWLLGGSAGNYEIMFNRTNGSALYTGTENTWLSLSTSRSWSLRATASQSKACGGFLAIRDNYANIELANVAFSMDVESAI
jgi:hypothetical protein